MKFLEYKLKFTHVNRELLEPVHIKRMDKTRIFRSILSIQVITTKCSKAETWRTIKN